MAAHRFDVVIAGGGMVGATLALALRDSSHRIAVVEPTAPGASDQASVQPSYDDRGIALSLASERVLRRVGAWPALAPHATPIRAVHVTEAGRFGCVRLDAARLGVEAFGHVVTARAIGAAIWGMLRTQENATILCPDMIDSLQQDTECVTAVAGRAGMLSCRLLVIADGAESSLRAQLPTKVSREDYGQIAIVANVTAAEPHREVAYERFGPRGPLALLPLANGRMVSVNCVDQKLAQEWLALPDAAYCGRLDERFGGRLGGFMHCGARRAYPLRRIVPGRQVSGRTVLLGAAALNIHPNGAQGFNVALRDVAGLAAAIAAEPDPGRGSVLNSFVAERAGDRERVMQVSHGLVRAFTSEHVLAGPLRQAALLLTEFLPPLKRDVMLVGAGLYGHQPAWVRTPA